MPNHAFEDETALRNPLQAWQKASELYVNSVGCTLDTHLGDARSVIVSQNDERLARLECDDIARLRNPAGASLGATRIDSSGHRWTSGGNWPESIGSGKRSMNCPHSLPKQTLSILAQQTIDRMNSLVNSMKTKLEPQPLTMSVGRRPLIAAT